MAKANRIYLPKEEAISRLDSLANELALELYKSVPSPNDDEIAEVINYIDHLIEVIKYSAIEKVTFFHYYQDVAKTRKTTLHIELPRPEITWKKFANLKND